MNKTPEERKRILKQMLDDLENGKIVLDKMHIGAVVGHQEFKELEKYAPYEIRIEFRIFYE